MAFEKSAGAIIFKRDNNQIYYLLLHYKSGHWEFPKGHIEIGEKDYQTVIREVAEETGIKDIRIIKGFKVWVKYFFKKTYGLKKEEKKNAPSVFKIVNFYLAETHTKEIKLSDEHIGFIWLTYEEAINKLTFKNAKEILKKANEFLQK